MTVFWEITAHLVFDILSKNLIVGLVFPSSVFGVGVSY